EFEVKAFSLRPVNVDPVGLTAAERSRTVEASMQRRRAQVSAIIVCFNEEDNIRACLESVAWCDEIVVIDAHSTDRTLDIVREFPDRIFVRDWPGYREQKQFALDQARLEWVLNLDADERVSAELRAEIQHELADGAPAVDGFYVPRLVHYLGRW